jgi:hypothetical protein
VLQKDRISKTQVNGWQHVIVAVSNKLAQLERSCKIGADLIRVLGLTLDRFG